MDYYLISKYLNGKATEAETNQLFQWINQDKKNKEEFVEIKKMWAMASVDVEDPDLAWIDLKKEKARKDKKHRLFKVSGYAAALIGVLLAGVLYSKYQLHSIPEEIIIDGNAIVLKLDNGDIKVLNDDGTGEIYGHKDNLIGKQNGKTLVYGGNSKNEALVYNELSIPYGKTFVLVLSDGSTVNLNAGSSIKYPIEFLKNGPREIFLEGEAFFDISKDTLRPFIVNTEKLNVQVLGTQFNVSSYAEDEIVETVLVEGSVRLENKDLKQNEEVYTTLEPGQKGEWNANKISVDQVDTSLYTAWLSGKIIFRNETFENIKKKLERHYNVTIENNNAMLDKDTYSATFDFEGIEKVMRTFNESYPIDYSIEGNHITIN